MFTASDRSICTSHFTFVSSPLLTITVHPRPSTQGSRHHIRSMKCNIHPIPVREFYFAILLFATSRLTTFASFRFKHLHVNSNVRLLSSCKVSAIYAGAEHETTDQYEVYDANNTNLPCHSWEDTSSYPDLIGHASRTTRSSCEMLYYVLHKL